MRIRIIFRGNSVSYIQIEKGCPRKLVALIDAEGECYMFGENFGYFRNWNKVV